MPNLCGRDIYSQVPLPRLLDQQTAAMAPDLQRCFGQHALLLTASVKDLPPVLPLLGHWVRLNAGRRYEGDLVAAPDEPLPFVDDAFDLVLLRHALEVVPAPMELLQEAARVLCPGGILVVTGIHPASGWAPWFYWRSRGQQRTLWMPWRLCQWLRRSGLDIERRQRVGGLWPSERSVASSLHVVGGGYVLTARKRRVTLTPLRVTANLRQTVTHVQWSPGVQRR